MEVMERDEIRQFPQKEARLSIYIFLFVFSVKINNKHDDKERRLLLSLTPAAR